MATIENDRVPATQLEQVQSDNMSRSQQEKESLTSPVSLEAQSIQHESGVASPTSRVCRRFQPLRFGFGLILTTFGISMILFVAIRVFESHFFTGRFAMTLVALTILCGVVLLGGGFGLMMTASADFDDGEFERLLNSGNIAAVDSQPPVANSGNVPAKTSRRAA